MRPICLHADLSTRALLLSAHHNADLCIGLNSSSHANSQWLHVQAQVQHMREWLANTASPSSKIEKVEFGTEEELDSATMHAFAVRR
jgi:hypothetical protein